MAKCVFENLTAEQAKVLASWFEGQGEQDCVPWFDASATPPPLTDVQRQGGYREILPNGDVVVYCTPTGESE
jgi:hypothetical protein